MLRWQRSAQSIFIETSRSQGRRKVRRLRSAYKSKVQTALKHCRQLLVGCPLFELQAHTWPTLAIRQDQAGNDLCECSSTHKAYSKLTEFAPLNASGNGAGPVRLCKQRPSFRQQGLTCRRQFNTPIAALEKPSAELFFQHPNLVTERRLGHVEPKRCTTEVQCLGKNDEVAEAAKIHDTYFVSILEKTILDDGSNGSDDACSAGKRCHGVEHPSHLE